MKTSNKTYIFACNLKLMLRPIAIDHIIKMLKYGFEIREKLTVH